MKKEKNKKKKNYQVELIKVMRSHVADLYAAKEKSAILHGSSDIKSSGNEIELAVRRVIKKIIPDKYYVGHGHIIDSIGNVSSQIDIIIADKEMFSVVFRGEDGTEYFTYESVYAIGEVKSSYASGVINDFQAVIEKIKTFHRKDSPPNYLGRNVFLGDGIKTSIATKRNPLFCFMILLSKASFRPEAAYEVYTAAKKDDLYLPNVICLLDSGLICKAVEEGNTIISYVPIPEHKESRENIKWIFQAFGEIADSREHNLAAFSMLLLSHLHQCLLIPPDIASYFKFVKQSSALDLTSAIVTQENEHHLPD